MRITNSRTNLKKKTRNEHPNVHFVGLTRSRGKSNLLRNFIFFRFLWNKSFLYTAHYRVLIFDSLSVRCKFMVKSEGKETIELLFTCRAKCCNLTWKRFKWDDFVTPLDFSFNSTFDSSKIQFDFVVCSFFFFV